MRDAIGKAIPREEDGRQKTEDRRQKERQSENDAKENAPLRGAATEEPPLTDGQRKAIERLRESIPDIFRRMKVDPLAGKIAGAMYAADANGRAGRLRELTKRGGFGTAALAGEEPEYLVDPATFTGAKDWFDRKVSMPTGLTAREISNEISEPIRNQAFFSAQVASANVLQSLREECDAILAGKSTTGQARKRLTEFLAAEGYGIPKPGTKEDRDIGDITSTARMELVLRQNVAMAQAVGARKVSEHPFVVERYPNYRYLANTERHAQFDNLVLPKNHPFWATHYPPWDYNCNCLVIDEEGESNARGGGDFRDAPDGSQTGRVDYKNKVLNVGPNKSGFVFRSSPADAFRSVDYGIIEDAALRAIAKDRAGQ